MKFTIQRKILLNALVKVSRAVSLKNPLPSLNGIKFELTNSELILTGSDSDITIQTSISESLNIIKTGSIVLSSKYILEIIKKIDSEVIDIELMDGTLTKISGGSSTFQLNGMSSFDYPRINLNQTGIQCTLDSFTLKTIIDKTVYATSDKETRPVLTGVNFKAEGKTLTCIATDSYRLSQISIPIEDLVTFNIIIPKKSLIELNHIIEKKEKLDIYINNKRILFIVDEYIVLSRLIDGSYPDTSKLISNHYDYTLSINSTLLLSAIDRASLLSEDSNIVKLDMNEDNVVLSSNSQEIGSVKEELSTAFYKGDDLSISFSAKYLTDALRSVNTQTVKIEFSGRMKPFIVKDLEEDDNIQVILPVRTY